MPEGLFYWDGEKWNQAKYGGSGGGSDDAWKLKGNGNTDPDVNFIGTTDNKALSIRTDNQKRMTITEAGNVGIGLGNTVPTKRLEVVGTSKLDGAAGVYIPQLPTNISAENAYSVVVTNDGHLEKVGTAGSNKAFNYIIYEIENMEMDWIRDFDTSIRTSNYTLIIVGSSFSIPGDYVLRPVMNRNPQDHVDFGTTVVQNVFAYEYNGTWRLHADFDKGSPTTNAPCKWTLYCIAINNSMVKKFEVEKHNMNGRNKYTAQDPPEGGL